MDLQGTVKTVGTIEEKGAKGFKIAKVILDRTSSYQGQEYPNFTEITFQGNKTDLLEERNIAVGDFVTVSGDLQGRFFEYNGEKKFAQDVVCSAFVITEKKQSDTAAAAPTQEPKEHY